MPIITGWRISIRRRCYGRPRYGLAFALFSAAMAFTVAGDFPALRRIRLGLLDALQPSAYGIYLLHYIFIIWLQYAVYDYSFPAVVKFAIVFAGTLSMSWAAHGDVAKNSFRGADDLNCLPAIICFRTSSRVWSYVVSLDFQGIGHFARARSRLRSAVGSFERPSHGLILTGSSRSWCPSRRAAAPM